jgi:protein pelota
MSCASETAALERFFETLALCEDKVTYGPKSVDCALREKAVETLLISDKLFRAKNIEQRKYYVGLYEQAQRDGLSVVIFGSMSAPGIRLNGLTGIACILRFELPALLEMIEDDEGDCDSESEGEMGEVGGGIAVSESDVTSQSS